jgi:thioredoxin-like negative regulator of GroEL
MAVKFRLYSRTGCHLCDEMLKDLEALRRTTNGTFTVEVLDIDRDPETQRRYSLRIPVLTAEAGAKVLCETRFHRQSVLDYLSAAGC